MRADPVGEPFDFVVQPFGLFQTRGVPYVIYTDNTVDLARANTEPIVFFASGFETTAVATALPAGSTLEVVCGTVDERGTADLTPSTAVRKVAAKSVKNGSYRVGVAPATGTYVRSQVRAADGAVVGVSNPVWLLPSDPKRPVPPDRRRTLP